MTTWGLVAVLAAVVMNAISGVLWVARPERVVQSIRQNLATIGVPGVGAAAAFGLILFWVCATFSHVRVGDWSTQFFATSCLFAPLSVGALLANVGWPS